MPRSPADAIAWGMGQSRSPSQNWYRMCLVFVRSCFGLNGYYPTAGSAWDNAAHKHPTSDGNSIPAGVPVFWETLGTADHVALSIGGGKCLSTDVTAPGRVSVVGINELSDKWNCSLQGWTEDLNRVYLGKGKPGTWDTSTAGGDTGDAESYGTDDTLLNAFDWTPQPDPASVILAGPRALMNDVSLLGTLATLCGASMRSYMAAPNGDFIAWFPDYFGHYKMAAKMKIRDIELATNGFTITWDDSRLVTHQFTAGAATGYSTGTAPGGAVDLYQMAKTAGIATVEFEDLMEALFNVTKSDPNASNWLNPEAILQRFGARVDYQPMGTITGPQAEFWYACHLFQMNWAQQFSADVELTFMPEVWPGMLLELETFGFQAYVTAVTHTFDFQGGGFDTTATVIAPSATNGSGLYALPRANGKIPQEKGARPSHKPKKKGKGKKKAGPSKPHNIKFKPPVG